MAKQTFLTVSFRLRPPTRRKQIVLDYVFAQYTQEVQRLLDWAEHNLTAIRDGGKDARGSYTADSIRPCLPTNTEWVIPLSSTLKDGIFADVCGMIASFLELEGADLLNGWPSALTVVTDEPREKALMEFGALEASPALAKLGPLRSSDEHSATGAQVEALLNPAYERELAAGLRKKAYTKERPLTYTRGRDFDLLLTADLQHPYVFLPLLPNKNTMVEPVDFGQKNMLSLWSNDPGITPTLSGKRRNGLLLPLELGKRGGKFHWQYKKFLMAMLDGNGVPKSAKVVKRNGHYFINVSVAFPTEAPYEPQTYMGITDNVLYDLSYAIVDRKGELLFSSQEETGLLDLKMDARKQIRRKQKQGKAVSYLDYKQSAQDELLHILVNRLLREAQERRAGIVLMDGEGIYTRRNTGRIRRVWAKVEFIIAYKCKMLGIPYRTGIFSARAAFICPSCGGDCSRDERSAVCVQCGGIKPIGVTKAINIARRILYRKSEWANKGGYRGFHKQFG